MPRPEWPLDFFLISSAIAFGLCPRVGTVWHAESANSWRWRQSDVPQTIPPTPARESRYFQSRRLDFRSRLSDPSEAFCQRACSGLRPHRFCSIRSLRRHLAIVHLHRLGRFVFFPSHFLGLTHGHQAVSGLGLETKDWRSVVLA